MPNAIVQVTLWPTSNLQADASTNTWSFEYLDLVGLQAAVDELKIFYQGLQSYWPAVVRQSDHTIKAYNRADPEPRAPILEDVFSFAGAPSGTPLPTEVCICMSFQGVAASGSSQARRRGRVYLGPLKDANIGTDGRPNSALITAVETAGQGLLDASDAATDWIWEVWSTVNGNAVPVDNGWVDNEYDTQRRRGRVATARQTFN